MKKMMSEIEKQKHIENAKKATSEEIAKKFLLVLAKQRGKKWTR